MNASSDSLFALPETAQLLREEMDLARLAARRQPGGRALLLRPCRGAAEPSWDAHHLPAIDLHVADNGFDGQLRCAADAMPWEDAAFQMIIAQHAADALPAASPLIAELARLLAPGGVLLWFGLNPQSPWLSWCRWQARRRSSTRGTWTPPTCTRAYSAHRQLACQRLDTEGAVYVGAYWPRSAPVTTSRRHLYGLETLRAAYLLAARKRPALLTPLRPAARRRMAMHPQLAGTPSQRACA
ncbi:MAG TPA: methyltransferase domain-containing protein [Rhodanobacteraceae bacterium]|nr:methyltransferase domain-containing protein [Rhodanobacteraceae bacterium]